MITGAFDADLEATIVLSVQGPGGERELKAVIDTGFTGFLTLPASVVAALELAWCGCAHATLGDGSVHLVDLYEGTVIWDGNPQTVEIETAETEPLVGMAMIYGHELRIQAIENGSVTIKALPVM